MKGRVLKDFLIILFIFAVAGGGVFGSPQQEARDEGPTIGIIYRTMTTAYTFNDQQFQCFYQSESRHWNALAEEEGFNLIEIEGGVFADRGLLAVEQLINRDVDAIFFCFTDPAGVAPGIESAQEAGIPVVIGGIPPAADIEAPFIGFDGYGGGLALGRETAELFRINYPDRVPRILVVNTPNIELNEEKERGFLEGFTSVLTAAAVVRTPPDDGTIRTTMEIVTQSLARNPDINVVFASNDFRGLGVIQALNNRGMNSKDAVILAGMGGSANAFQEIMDPTSPWRIEAGYKMKDMVMTGYDMITKMWNGEMPIRNSEEEYIGMEIFVEPSTAEVEQYLLEHHRITDFRY